jgi:hypothetical protein
VVIKIDRQGRPHNLCADCKHEEGWHLVRGVAADDSSCAHPGCSCKVWQDERQQEMFS